MSDWEVVWRSACLFTTVEPRAKQVFQVQMCMECKLCQKCQSYKETVDLFHCGGMDRQLLDKCRVMDPFLDVMQLQFLVDKAHATMVDLHPDQLASQMELARDAQCEAEFRMLEAKMLSEQALFRENCATVPEVMEKAAKARDVAVRQHLQRHSRMAVLPDRSHMAVNAILGFQEFCEGHPAKSAESALKINLVSMPALGVQHSLHTDGIINQAVEDLAANPRTSTWIILCPNTPRFGHGASPAAKQDFHEAVVEAGRSLEDKLTSKSTLKFRLVTGQLDPGSLRSRNREWRVDFYVIISSQTDEFGALMSVWSRSNCWIRRHLSVAVKVMDKTQYRNWGAPVMLPGSRLDWAAEFRQHFTGVDFWSTFLLDLCSIGLARPNLPVYICDMTLNDPELAKAVVNLHARGGNFPKFGYLGMTHRNHYHSGVGANIVNNAWFALVSHTISMVEAGTLTLPGCTPIVPAGGGVHGVCGVHGFEVCMPLSQHLPIRQAVHDWWSKVVGYTERFEALVKDHNVIKGFNPGGVPFKLTRAADTSVQDLEHGMVAISIPREDGGLDSLSKLEAAYPAGLRTLALSGSLSLLVASDGSAYIVNITGAEIIVDKNEPLLRIKAWDQSFVVLPASPSPATMFANLSHPFPSTPKQQCCCAGVA